MKRLRESLNKALDWIDEQLFKKVDEWIKREWKNLKKRSWTLRAVLALIVLLSGVFGYHYLLIRYVDLLAWLFPGQVSPDKGLNIGIIGDSLAVLSFMALIVSLVLTARELMLSREEMVENRKTSEKRNKIEAEHEVLANIRALAENIKDVPARDPESVHESEWISRARTKIIAFNLSRLIEHSLEVLVKITREEKESSPLLAQFAQEVIDKSKGNLGGLNFSGQDLTDAKLSAAFLVGANLSEARLTLADLSEAILHEAKLSGANLFRADLSSSTLTDADLSKAILISTGLNYADLESADLSCANMRGSNLRNAKGISTDQIKKAIFWEKAHYDKDFRKKLGLPPKEDEHGDDHE